LSIGPERYQAFEILFQPHLANLEILGLAEALYTVAMGSTEFLDKRFSLWDSVLLTGGVSVVPGIQERLEQELQVFLCASETGHEFQAKDVKFLRIPEYLSSAFKEGGADAAFLGGVVVSR
ncbi:UNVERIFIED_CONTAM: Arp2/3 complex subunit, actin nucleation center, partial [Siphonaria sp. JEL0065]